MPIFRRLTAAASFRLSGHALFAVEAFRGYLLAADALEHAENLVDPDQGADAVSAAGALGILGGLDGYAQDAGPRGAGVRLAMARRYGMPVDELRARATALMLSAKWAVASPTRTEA